MERDGITHSKAGAGLEELHFVNSTHRGLKANSFRTRWLSAGDGSGLTGRGVAATWEVRHGVAIFPMERLRCPSVAGALRSRGCLAGYHEENHLREDGIAAGLPEVYFLEFGMRGEQGEPLTIGDADECPHAPPQPCGTALNEVLVPGLGVEPR